jgi:hypothetical protein
MNTYYPLEVYRFGKPEDAYRLLTRLISPDLNRREYPEVSYAAIETFAMGLMGIEADAGTRLVRTRSRLTSATTWAELKDLPIFDGTVTIRHDGLKKSTFTNHTAQSIRWENVSPDGKTRTFMVKAGKSREAFE